MAGFKKTERIGRPQQDVFAYISDLDNVPRWLPGVIEVEKLTDGPVAVGTRYRETRQAAERKGYVEMEVTAFDPPRTFATSFDQGGYETTYRYILEADGKGTNVTLECAVEADGWKILLAPFTARAMERFDKRLLKSLKAAIEGPGRGS